MTQGNGSKCSQCDSSHCSYCSKCSRLGVFSFAFAVGIASALGVLFLGWMGHFYGWGIGIIRIVGSIYKGFEATIVGGAIGASWAFLDGFIWALIVAVIYNLCVRCCCCCSKHSSKSPTAK